MDTSKRIRNKALDMDDEDQKLSYLNKEN